MCLHAYIGMCAHCAIFYYLISCQSHANFLLICLLKPAAFSREDVILKWKNPGNPIQVNPDFALMPGMAYHSLTNDMMEVETETGQFLQNIQHSPTQTANHLYKYTNNSIIPSHRQINFGC